jgi:diguanylate cyclase (GGDEF)-like protein/PAS domain S-box-containing protein
LIKSRIMIVEDERIVALDLKQNLESCGLDVVAVASSGEQAVAEAARHHPDLILMDINLDGAMDGTAAALEIRSRLRIPVIFLTAYTEERTLQRAEASVPYGYLVKPVESRELQAALRMALARRQAETKVEQTEERLRLAVDTAGLGVWEWEDRTGQLHGGGHLEQILGRTPASLYDGEQPLLDFIHPQDRPGIETALRRGDPVSTTVRINRYAEGGPTERWVDLNARSVPGSQPAIKRLIGVLRDVTMVREQQDRLQQAAVVFRATAEGIAILDPERRVLSINPAFEELTGHALELIAGRDPADFLVARRHGDSIYDELDSKEGNYWSGEIACLRRDGTVFAAWQNLCAVADDDGEVINYVMALSDITAIRRAEAELNHLAFHDPLTGLGNRNKLNSLLESELERAQARHERVALLFLDLDGFKLINDTMGHAAGDHLLRVVADRISGLLRRSDTAIRLGGDEFVIVVPGVTRMEDCAGLAEKLLAELRTGIDLDRERVSISGSIGIATYPDNATDHHELVKAADNAMYNAKQHGRNRYAFYSETMAEHALARLQIEQGLLRAIADEQLELFYQPVVSLSDARVIGFEALIRWRHPEQGLIPPDQFIPVAEDCGLIEYIGSWVLRTACAQARAWMDAGYAPIRMAVNVSVLQLASEAFLDMLRDALAESGFPPERLELEITESSIQTIEHSRDLFGHIHALGPSISIDDFGTGFSSLSLLKYLPIDRVKIDRAFTRDLPQDQNDVAITRAIVALAKSLGLALIAEGVETAAQQEFLLALGCEEAQGYLFSKPLPVGEAVMLLGGHDKTN